MRIWMSSALVSPRFPCCRARPRSSPRLIISRSARCSSAAVTDTAYTRIPPPAPAPLTPPAPAAAVETEPLDVPVPVMGLVSAHVTGDAVRGSGRGSVSGAVKGGVTVGVRGVVRGEGAGEEGGRPVEVRRVWPARGAIAPGVWRAP